MGEEEIRLDCWTGSIPIVLSLAPTSLSSPTMPPPIHVMLSRMTLLHVGLRSAVMRLHKFAPAVISIKGGIRNEPDPGTDMPSCDEEQTSTTTVIESSTKDYPVCWFEDEETQIALRWHVFVGVLFDLKRRNKGRAALPWKIRLHFTSYPSSQILPIDTTDGVWTTMERTVMNSLKQSLFLQHGSSKVAMNMSKQSHHRVWDSIVTSNYQLYRQVNPDLQAKCAPSGGRNSGVQSFPVRLLIDSKPPIQRPCPAYCRETDATKSADQEAPYTLGALLADWSPELFVVQPDGSVTPESNHVVYCVQGIEPPLSSFIQDLWSCLCHPDHFLYIVVTTR